MRRWIIFSAVTATALSILLTATGFFTPKNLGKPAQTNGSRVGQRLFVPTGAQTAQANNKGGGGSIDGIDREMLARIIRAEAEAEPFTGQVAVGAVILNRIESPDFPNTLAGVIFQPHAFESVTNGTANLAPTESARKAAESAIQGWDPSGGALFFFNPAKTSNKFIWSRQIINHIGKHVFAL